MTSLSDKTEPFAAEEPAPPVSEGDLPEVRQKEEPKPPANPMYARYMSAQRDKPDAVVLIRLGDFYEVMGERAREVSEWLNLTLTSRDVGLSERVPMCGFPYHVTEQYLQAILEHRGVYVLEPDAEPIYILSRAELSESERSETAPVEILTHYSELINAVDFFFVYQRMYNGNCLNIRNECAHGRKYIIMLKIDS